MTEIWELWIITETVAYLQDEHQTSKKKQDLTPFVYAVTFVPVAQCRKHPAIPSGLAPGGAPGVALAWSFDFFALTSMKGCNIGTHTDSYGAVPVTDAGVVFRHFGAGGACLLLNSPCRELLGLLSSSRTWYIECTHCSSGFAPASGVGFPVGDQELHCKESLGVHPTLPDPSLEPQSS